MNEQTPEIVQQEITNIESDIAQQHSTEQRESAESLERSEVHHVVGQKIYNDSTTPPLQPITQPQSGHQPSYLLPEFKDQVQTLITSAFTESIDKAIEQARASGNPGLIDAFHDALVDELYPILVERAKLRNL